MGGLNKRQQEAVEASEGRVRVVAGAGSGKTRVLAHRYAFLVNELGISAGNILCLTFTNKAAQEMKRRISGMVDRGSVNDFICTIHSFCAKFLRREIYRIGYPKSFSIIDETDARQLAKQAMEEFGIDRKKTTAERFLKGVAAFKGYDISGYIQKHLLPGSSAECPDATTRYLRLQLKQYVLDYDDLIYFTIYILDHFPDARDYWTDRLNYIMVDEVQDCSGDDWKLLNILAERHGNLFVVGDPDQAIYEWRGGNPSIFVKFKADTDIILNQNYRSTPDVLDVANAIIANNRNRIKKELFTVRLNERRTVYHHAKNEKEESEMIVRRIADGIKEGESPSSYAVLYRSSFLSRRIEQMLLQRQIPYTVWGGVRFFERREIKDIIGYLKLIDNDADDIAFRRIVNVPPRKFGTKSLERLTLAAEAEGKSLLAALRDHEGEKGFNTSHIRDFLNLIQAARQRLDTMKVSELTDWVLNESRLSDLYRNDEEEERLENLAELVNSMKEFEDTRFEEGEADVTRYLQEISLYTDTDHLRDTEKVRLMTIHQSKGLEFPTVFLMGLTEGIFPNHRSIRERRENGEEEERRLMYVAVTRAESMLYLSESEGFLNDNGALRYPSRFISEIPEEYLTVEGNPDPSLREGTRNMIATLNAEIGNVSEAPMATGTIVEHRVFGRGEIESYDAASQSYRVKFPGATRNLIPRVLTRIEGPR